MRKVVHSRCMHVRVHVQYVARIMRMFERQEDGSKMVTCKWFYRANETVLARDKKQLAQVVPRTLMFRRNLDKISGQDRQLMCTPFPIGRHLQASDLRSHV